MATVTPELHIAVFHHEYGVDCFTFYFAPSDELKYPSPRKVAEYFQIDFEPDKGETFVLLPTNISSIATLAAEQVGRKTASTAFWWEESDEGWLGDSTDEDDDADDSVDTLIGSDSVAEQPSPSEIRLPCYGIVVQLQELPSAENPGSGTITSDLKQDLTGDDDEYLGAIDGLESLILAHACAGIDVTLPGYIEGVKTAVEAISNNLG